MIFVRYFVIIALILAVSSSVMPVYLAEDASHNGTVGLEDVILQVQDFTESASNTGPFAFNFERLLSTLSAVAGLKTLINPNKAGKSSKHQVPIVISLDKITNSFSIHLPPLLTSAVEFSEYLFLLESRSLMPTSPPPRFV